MKMVKAWNGKWHLFEHELRVAPAIPKRISVAPDCDRTDRHHDKTKCWDCEEAGKTIVLQPLPQPERMVVVTTCGEEVYAKQVCDVPDLRYLAELVLGRGRNAVCQKCPITHRLPA